MAQPLLQLPSVVEVGLMVAALSAEQVEEQSSCLYQGH